MRGLASVILLAACGGAPNLCNTAQLSFTCRNNNGQCVEFTGLSTHDSNSAESQCNFNRGTQLQGSCPTDARLGTCVIPNDTPNSGVTCSPNGQIAIRYFAPYTATSAQSACNTVPGAVWTPN
jgi:hypothetical protein